MKWAARRAGMVPDGWVGGLVQFDRRCPAIGSGTRWAQAGNGR